MSVRIMVVYVEIDDDISQGDEFETLMDEVTSTVSAFRDPVIRKVKVIEP